MAKAPAKAETRSQEIVVSQIQQHVLVAYIVGNHPLYFNSMSEKARRTLLMPEVMGRRTRAERSVEMKHNPVEEYRNSVYRTLSNDKPTRLLLPSPAFKGAMTTAALDLPGTRKSEIGRLVTIEGTHVPVWGVPQLKMDVVRSADMNKTPDVRTRAYLPEWASVVRIRFVSPNLKAESISNLISAAGILSGVGDFRQEKGKGSYGQFRVVSGTDDEDFQRIVATGGREAQDAALKKPEAADAETEQLLAWYSAEVIKLKEVTVSDDGGGKRRRKDAA